MKKFLTLAGIVRRIDDLGRIVVPKEIRRVLRIREGDSMEIFTDIDGAIVLKKYSPIGELGGVAKQYAESIAQVSGQTTIITDRDSVIAAAGISKRDVLGKRISKKLESIIAGRNLVRSSGGQAVNIIENEDAEQAEQVICPIICEGDVIGSVIIMAKTQDKQMTGVEEKLATMASNFLGRRMEV